MTKTDETLRTGRRDFLGLMGLGVTGSMLANTEAIAEHMGEGYPQMSKAHPGVQAKFAECLENLAAALRRGDVACIDISTESRIDFHDVQWLKHELRMSFEIVKGEV